MTNKNILVTGASRGIGLALVEQFIKQDHLVVATYRQKNQSLDQLAKTNSDKLKLIPLAVDLDESVDNLPTHLHELGLHVLDILINNAGIGPDTFKSFSETTWPAALDTFNTNSVGPMRVTRALLPYLERSKQGMILNMSSRMGSIGRINGSSSYAYRMSKAALNMFTRLLSIDYPDVLTVSLHPGWVRTDMGGQEASLSAEESASALVNLVSNLEPNDSGKFLNYEGKEFIF